MSTGLIIRDKVHIRLLLTLLSFQPVVAGLAAPDPHVITTRDDEGCHALYRVHDV